MLSLGIVVEGTTKCGLGIEAVKALHLSGLEMTASGCHISSAILEGLPLEQWKANDLKLRSAQLPLHGLALNGNGTHPLHASNSGDLG